jgi:hypothetical protein
MQSRYLLAAVTAAVLSACGGGGGEAQGTAPGGLYVGYYQEDAVNNPEDPMPGSYYLQLPEGNASFAGEMSFTYIGCQTSNVGTVSGNKNGVALDGNWTGTVDGTPVGGPYTGRYDAAGQRYSGTYRNAGGKVHISGCDNFEYDVAALGTWEMFPVESRSPADFTISVAGGNVNWTAVAGVSRWLASVYDVARTTTGSNAVTQQALFNAAQRTVPLASLGLTTGRAYVLAITAFNSSNQRVGYTSLRYTAP